MRKKHFSEKLTSVGGGGVYEPSPASSIIAYQIIFEYFDSSLKVRTDPECATYSIFQTIAWKVRGWQPCVEHSPVFSAQGWLTFKIYDFFHLAVFQSAS
jgi:hypothetical protein